MKRLITIIALLVPLVAAAETYEWIDDQGRRYFTDNLNRVPEKYRGSATRLESVKPSRDALYRDAERRAREEAESARRQQIEDARDRAKALAEAERERANAIAAQDERWNQAAGLCARYSRVQIAIKPGARVTILGTTQQRFNFEKCMTESGFAPERY